jgi:D-aspartate ligase
MSKVFSLEIEENMEPTFPLRETKKVGAVIIGGNFQGLGVLRSLGKQHVPVYLLDQDLCIGRFSRYTTKFFRCPDVKQETRFLAFLTDLAIKEDLKGWVVYPNDDETVRFLAKNKESLEKYYRITTPSWDIVKFAYDKSLTTEAARRSGVTVPGVYYPRTVAELEQFDIKFPVILKPSVKEPFYNRTKKKAIKIDSRQELIAEYSRSVPLLGEGQVLMAQEFIPGGVNNLFSVGRSPHAPAPDGLRPCHDLRRDGRHSRTGRDGP